jgi:hypothetical protein
LSAINCPTKDSGVYGASLSVSRLAKEWWLATDPALKQSDGLGVVELRNAVNDAWDVQGDKKSWKQVAGPVGAAVWWMKCAQWAKINEATFQDDQGNFISMVDLPPGEVGKMFRNSLWRFSADLEVSKWVNKYAADSQEGTQLLDKGPWWEPQQKYMRSTKPSRLDKVLVAAYNAGGVVTALKLNQWGYDIDPICSCGQLDTQYHRAWTCTRPDVLKARNDAGNKRILRLAAGTPGAVRCLPGCS